MGLDVVGSSTASGSPSTAFSPSSWRSFPRALELRLFRPPVADHRGDDVQQLAAGAAGRHGHRPLAGLRLHHLRRPEQFHLRAAAVGAHRLRHPGRDADRGLADRRELRHRHEPAQSPAQGRQPRTRPSSAWRSAWRWSASCSTGRWSGSTPSASQGAAVQGFAPTGGGSPTSRSISPSRCCWWPSSPSIPARRRHLGALRAERAHHRPQRRAVGDVPGLDGGLGVLLLRLALQRHISRRAAQARGRDAHPEPGRPRGRRHRRAGAEGAARGGGAAVRDRWLEGLRRAARAGWRSAAQGSQGEIERYFVSKMEDRRRGIVEQQERIAGAERNQTALLQASATSWKPSCSASSPASARWRPSWPRRKAAYDETRQAIAAKRIDASAEDGGVEGTLKRGKGPGLSPAHGRAGGAAAQAHRSPTSRD